MRIKIFYTWILLSVCFFIQNDLWAQVNSNELTPNQYNSIKFHGIKFSELKATKGEIIEMKKLLAIDKICEGGIEIGEKWRSFHRGNNLMIYFSGLSENQKPELSILESNSISIEGKQAEIGDSIETLGPNLVISSEHKGYNYYIFTLGNADCCPISIKVDTRTNKILQIRYYVQT